MMPTGMSKDGRGSVQYRSWGWDEPTVHRRGYLLTVEFCLNLCVFSGLQDCSFPAYFYTQPMATGPGFYDNLCPQSWQDGSAATFTLQDPHQQSKKSPTYIAEYLGLQNCWCFHPVLKDPHAPLLKLTLPSLTAFDCPGN